MILILLLNQISNSLYYHICTYKDSKNTKIWSWDKITENHIKNDKEEVPKYETLDELIALLLEVRVDLAVLQESVNSEYIKEELKWAINGIDIVGCGLSQNISKKLKEK